VPKPLTQAKRDAITADIHAGKARNQIARDHGVSGSTVTKIAQETGNGATAFDRSQTEKATRAKRFDAAAARVQLIEDLYGDAQRFRQRSWSDYTQIVSGPAGAELVTTKLPPLRDQQSAYTSLAICLDKAAKLEQADAADGEAGFSAVDEWLADVLSEGR
jgi:transposase-like protein